jgi:hypothetical protein
MNTGAQRSLGIAMLVGYLVSAAVVIMIPVLLIPADQRSPYFWYKVGWVEFLTLLVWAYFGGFLRAVVPPIKKTAGLGGVLPITGGVILAYAFLSLLLVVLCDWPSRGHWACQIILLAVAVLLIVSLTFARSGAVAGTDPIPPGVHALQDLSAMLRMQEERLRAAAADGPLRSLSDSLKSLRETLEYSLPHVGRIGTLSEYREFAQQVEQYCSELQGIGADAADAQKADRLRDGALQLKRQAEYIASMLKTRPA